MKITIEELEFDIERAEVGGRYGYKVTVNNIETMIFPYLLKDDKVYWKTEDGRTSPLLQSIGEAMEDAEM